MSQQRTRFEDLSADELATVELAALNEVPEDATDSEADAIYSRALSGLLKRKKRAARELVLGECVACGAQVVLEVDGDTGICDACLDDAGCSES